MLARPARPTIRPANGAAVGLAALVLTMTASGCDRVNKFISAKASGSAGESAEAAEEAATQVGPRLECRDEGKIEVSLPLRTLGKRLNGEQISVLDPYEEARVPFEGALLESLLDNVYGRRWRLKASIRFGMDGGFQTQIAVADVIKTKAWLAWRRMDRPEFVVERRAASGQFLNLAPLYLVWDSDVDAAIRARGTWGWLPGVTSLDLSSSVGNTAALKPAAGSDEAVARGYGAYAKFCATCHTISGIGGLGGPELMRPVPITRWMSRDWLRAWIDRPLAVRDRSSMPPLPADLPDRDRTIDDVIAFLNYSADHPLANAATATSAPATQAKP